MVSPFTGVEPGWVVDGGGSRHDPVMAIIEPMAASRLWLVEGR